MNTTFALAVLAIGSLVACGGTAGGETGDESANTAEGNTTQVHDNAMCLNCNPHPTPGPAPQPDPRPTLKQCSAGKQAVATVTNVWGNDLTLYRSSTCPGWVWTDINSINHRSGGIGHLWVWTEDQNHTRLSGYTAVSADNFDDWDATTPLVEVGSEPVRTCGTIDNGAPDQFSPRYWGCTDYR